MRYSAYGEDIFGYILADGAVSSGGADGESAVFIGNGHGQAVDFRLYRVEDIVLGYAVFGKGGVGFIEEGTQFILGENVGEASHFHGVCDLSELFGCAASDLMGRRIG